MKIVDEGYKEAIKVLEHCAKLSGFYASGLPGGYEATWARDSMIASLGASLVENKFKVPFRKSLELLGKNQSEKGQIPNAVGCYNEERKSDTTFNSIDSSLWYIIGHYVYSRAYRDHQFLKRNKKKLEKALLWIQYQDPNEDGLPVQQPTMDWEDAFPHKYGRTINTQALYYFILKITKNIKEANKLKKIVNGEQEKYLSLYSKRLGFYHPWIWKTHGPDFREGEDWFDTLGNLLAIITGLATPKISKSILNYIEKNKINRPFPCKSIWPPIEKRDGAWHDYFEHAEARKPYHYLNAGVWPFIGGFYVAALVKTKNYTKAKKELENLARVNKIGRRLSQYNNSKILSRHDLKNKWQFLEWVEGKKGKVAGSSSPYQGWSAGAYLFAYESVRSRKTPFFE